MTGFRSALVLVAAFLATACTNSVAPSQLPQFHIAKVTVTTNAAAAANPTLAATTEEAARQYAGVYSQEIPPSAPARELVIQIDNAHYKNAAASLLVGDANRISGTAAVTNGAGASERRGEVAFTDTGSAAINGVVGAAMAAGADRSKVERTLAVGIAEKAVGFAYGQPRTPSFVDEILRGRRKPTYPPYRLAAPADPVTTGSVPQVDGATTAATPIDAVAVEIEAREVLPLPM